MTSSSDYEKLPYSDFYKASDQHPDWYNYTNSLDHCSNRSLISPIKNVILMDDILAGAFDSSTLVNSSNDTFFTYISDDNISSTGDISSNNTSSLENSGNTSSDNTSSIENSINSTIMYPNVLRFNPYLNQNLVYELAANSNDEFTVPHSQDISACSILEVSDMNDLIDVIENKNVIDIQRTSPETIVDDSRGMLLSNVMLEHELQEWIEQRLPVLNTLPIREGESIVDLVEENVFNTINDTTEVDLNTEQAEEIKNEGNSISVALPQEEKMYKSERKDKCNIDKISNKTEKEKKNSTKKCKKEKEGDREETSENVNKCINKPGNVTNALDTICHTQRPTVFQSNKCFLQTSDTYKTDEDDGALRQVLRKIKGSEQKKSIPIIAAIPKIFENRNKSNRTKNPTKIKLACEKKNKTSLDDNVHEYLTNSLIDHSYHINSPNNINKQFSENNKSTIKTLSRKTTAKRSATPKSNINKKHKTESLINSSDNDLKKNGNVGDINNTTEKQATACSLSKKQIKKINHFIPFENNSTQYPKISILNKNSPPQNSISKQPIRSALALSIIASRKAASNPTNILIEQDTTKKMISVLKKQPNITQPTEIKENITINTDNFTSQMQDTAENIPSPLPQEEKLPSKKINLAQYRSRLKTQPHNENSTILQYMHNAYTTTTPITDSFNNPIWSDKEVTSVAKPTSNKKEKIDKVKQPTCDIRIQTDESMFRLNIDEPKSNPNTRSRSRSIDRNTNRSRHTSRSSNTTDSSITTNQNIYKYKRSKNEIRYMNTDRNRSSSSCSDSSNSNSDSSSRSSRSRSRSRDGSRNRTRSRSHKTHRRRINRSHNSITSCSNSSSRSRSRSVSRSRYSRSRSRSRFYSQYSNYPRTSRYDRNYNRKREDFVGNYHYQDWRRSSYRNSCDDFYDRGKPKEIEERRVIYVGRLSDAISKAELHKRFEVFGPITDVSIHLRENGINYGFITFIHPNDAYNAIEHGNDNSSLPKYDLSFGGRRTFCQATYADLDAMTTSSVNNRSPNDHLSFDYLLKKARDDLQRRKD